jgi:hypothetical protein
MKEEEGNPAETVLANTRKPFQVPPFLPRFSLWRQKWYNHNEIPPTSTSPKIILGTCRYSWSLSYSLLPITMLYWTKFLNFLASYEIATRPRLPFIDLLTPEQGPEGRKKRQATTPPCCRVSQSCSLDKTTARYFIFTSDTRIIAISKYSYLGIFSFPSQHKRALFYFDKTMALYFIFTFRIFAISKYSYLGIFSFHSQHKRALFYFDNATALYFIFTSDNRFK